MHAWNMLHVARWKYRTQKIAILAPSYNFVRLYLRSWGMCRQSEKNLLNIDISSTCPHNMVNFSLLMADICWRVWGSPSNFNGFWVLALHGTLVVGVSQTLRRWTEAATYIRQGDHHVGHWPTFWPTFYFSFFSRGACVRLCHGTMASPSLRHSSSGRQPNFAALSRGRHLWQGGHHIGHWPTF